MSVHATVITRGVLCNNDDVTIGVDPCRSGRLTRPMNDTMSDAPTQDWLELLLCGRLEGCPQRVGVASPPGELASTYGYHRTQLAMYHSHLPEADAFDYTGWHRDARDVVKEPRFEGIHPVSDGWPATRGWPTTTAGPIHDSRQQREGATGYRGRTGIPG